MKKIPRSTYDEYFRLTCVIEQLSDYFYETRKDDTVCFPCFYEFCNYFLNNEEWEFTKLMNKDSNPWKWEIKHNGRILSEDEVYELYKKFTTNELRKHNEIIDEVNKDVDETKRLFTEKQIDQTREILKLFVNINGQFMFLDNNGQMNPKKVASLPYTGTKVTVNQIKKIRDILKKEKLEQHIDNL